MKINKISLANFRGFEHVEFGFERDVNVIAGENGIGKSSILCVLARLLAYVVSDFTKGSAKRQKFSDSDIRRQVDGAVNWFQVSGDFEFADRNFNFAINRVGLNAEQLKTTKEEIAKLELELPTVEGGNKRDRDKEVRRIKRDIAALEKVMTGGDERTSLLIAGLDVPDIKIDSRAPGRALQSFKSGLKKRPNQPVAVYYTTKRFFNDSFKSIPKSAPFSVLRAYSNALEDLDVSLKDFAHWFHFASGNAKGARIATRMTEVVSEFIPEFRNLRLADQGPIQFLVDKGGVTLPLTSLSDGERGLLAMVFDLTRRLSLANPSSEDPIGEGEAIVLIDEVELHLHPNWQREVLRRLLETFKNCQFIATTHSPQVIGEVPAKCVNLLSKREGKVIRETPAMAFGADSNWILNVLMKAHGQSEIVREDLAEISKLIAEKNLDSAAEKIAALRQTVGNTESIQRLASTIDRIRLLGK